MTHFKTRLSLQRYLESNFKNVSYYRDQPDYIYCIMGRVTIEVARWDYENGKAIILKPEYFQS